MEPLKILIADDHQMFIDGIRSLLRKEKRLQIVAEALNGAEALAYIENNPVDLLITDISMPVMNGTELTRKVKENFPEIKVIVLTMFNDREIINEIVETEAEGFLLKNTGKQELIEAILKVMDHGTYYCNEVVNIMLESRKMSRQAIENTKDLTAREIEIIRLILKEYSTAQIAEQLFISPRTVDTHRKHIMQKTKSRTLVGLIRFAIDNGISD